MSQANGPSEHSGLSGGVESVKLFRGLANARVKRSKLCRILLVPMAVLGGSLLFISLLAIGLQSLNNLDFLLTDIYPDLVVEHYYGATLISISCIFMLIVVGLLAELLVITLRYINTRFIVNEYNEELYYESELREFDKERFLADENAVKDMDFKNPTGGGGVQELVEEAQDKPRSHKGKKSEKSKKNKKEHHKKNDSKKHSKKKGKKDGDKKKNDASSKKSGKSGNKKGDEPVKTEVEGEKVEGDKEQVKAASELNVELEVKVEKKEEKKEITKEKEDKKKEEKKEEKREEKDKEGGKKERTDAADKEGTEAVDNISKTGMATKEGASKEPTIMGGVSKVGGPSKMGAAPSKMGGASKMGGVSNMGGVKAATIAEDPTKYIDPAAEGEPAVDNKTQPSIQEGEE